MKVAGVLFDAADANAIEEVNLAYENVKEVDGLDVSKEGMEAWEAAMKRYDERIDRVETRITARLRDQLGTAKNANEMFRIFSRFNALFVRPHIRGAIREYQTQLIQRVKDDIESLHDKFKVQYPQSQACKMSHVRDLPPVSGSIIWAKQIDRQLTAYMKRVEDVLGKGWENHVEGLKLKQDGDSFRAKLNTQEIFDDWARKVRAFFKIIVTTFLLRMFSMLGMHENVLSIFTILQILSEKPRFSSVTLECPAASSQLRTLAPVDVLETCSSSKSTSSRRSSPCPKRSATSSG